MRKTDWNSLKKRKRKRKGDSIVKKKKKMKLIFHIKVLGMVKVCNKREHYLNAEVVKKKVE